MVVTDNLPERDDFIDAEIVDRWDEIVDPIWGRPLYFDKEGKPISMRQWGELKYSGDMQSDYARIGWDEVPGEDRDGESAHVSTVWLGIDHGIRRGDDPPVIFETLVFGGPQDGVMLRYCTEEQAEVGHKAVVLALRNGLPLEVEE